MKSILKPGETSEPYAWPSGKKSNLNPNRYSINIANQKYGKAPMNAKAGGNKESSFEFLFQPIIVPSRVPIKKDIIRDVPAKNTVHDRAPDITVETS